MATSAIHLLSFKALFLVASTLARRASELAALRADAPYLQFFPVKVVLYPDASFLLKVVSSFHPNQSLTVLTLFPKPSSEVEHMLHSLDVCRAMTYYTSWTKDLYTSPKLFLCFHGPHKGSPASLSKVSRWIVSTIALAYELAGKVPPEGLKAHSTWAVATSTALLHGVDVPDICRAATWYNVSTFVMDYRLDLWAKKEASFGRVVLTLILE